MTNTIRTIIVGDVHGCIDELQTLMNIIAPNMQDHIVFCGDLVDKGPEPAAVVRYVRELGMCSRVTLVEGNHENKHRRWRHHADVNPINKNPVKLRDNDAALSKALNADDIMFLDSAVLFCCLKEYNSIVVHAGILPGMLRLPYSNRQIDMSPGEWKYFKQMMYVRYTRGNNMVMLGTEQPADVFWTDVYDGRFGIVYYGHQPRLIEHPEISSHAVGLDLGCCFGGRLVAVILTSDDRQFISVPAKKIYVNINTYMEQ